MLFARVCYVTNPDKSRPLEHAAKGARPSSAALEKRKRKIRGACKNPFIIIAILFLTILMDSKFKISVF